MPPENDDKSNDGKDNTNSGDTDESGETGDNLDDKGKQAEGDKTPEDDKKAEGDKDKDDDKVIGAPEKYEPYTLPEGIEISDADTSEFNDIAKESNLTQEQAQKLVDYESKRMASFTKAQVAENEKLVAGWLTTAKDDPDIGGVKFDENVAVANKALEKFGSPELVSFLEESGLGAHPEMIRSWNLVGKALSEDSVFAGASRGVDQRSTAEKMYPNQK